MKPAETLKLSAWMRDNLAKIQSEQPSVPKLRQRAIDELGIKASDRGIRDCLADIGYVRSAREVRLLKVANNKIEELVSIMSMIISMNPPASFIARQIRESTFLSATFGELLPKEDSNSNAESQR